MNVRLLVTLGKPAGKALVFGPGEYYLGRGPECQVRFNSDCVSRQHCLLRVATDRASLRDLSSRNGTLLNGQLLDAEQILKTGDQVQIGPVGFEVILERPSQPAAREGDGIPAVLRASDHDSSESVPLDSTAHHPMVTPDQPDEDSTPGSK